MVGIDDILRALRLPKNPEKSSNFTEKSRRTMDLRRKKEKKRANSGKQSRLIRDRATTTDSKERERIYRHSITSFFPAKVPLRSFHPPDLSPPRTLKAPPFLPFFPFTLLSPFGRRALRSYSSAISDRNNRRKSKKLTAVSEHALS